MKMFSPLEQFDIVVSFGLINGWSIPNVVLPLLLLLIFLVILVSVYKKEALIIPLFWQSLCEFFFFFCLNVLKQQIGVKGFKYFPLILNFFIFIFYCNLLSLTPYGLALTSHIIMIFSISFTLSLSVFLQGLFLQGSLFLKLFMPESPLLLLFILVPIEIFSYIIRALSLAIRLSANIIAGHTLVFIISSFLLLLFSFNFIVFFFSFFLILIVFLLEYGVAFLQAYVFIVLVSIYMHDSLYQSTH